MKLSREETLKVMYFHGFKNAGRWSNADLQTKLAQIPDVMIKGKVPEDPEVLKLHNAVLDACTKKEAFEVTGAEPEKKEEGKKTDAPKAAPAPKAPNPYQRVRAGKVAAFHCGVVLKEFGIEKGVTDEMIARYNELRGKVNNPLAETNLTWAWQVAHGLLKGLEVFQVDTPNEGDKGEQSQAKTEAKKEDTKAA
jgi:hypothetical protein